MPPATPSIITKTRSYDYRVAGFDHARAMDLTGLEYIQALVSGQLGAKPSIFDTFGVSVPFALEHGRASVEADPADFLMNPLGVLHGGFAATMLDTVLGVAVHTALPVATSYTTVELKINYTRAILPDTGRLRADGRVIHVGRRLATSEAKLTGIEDGKLYAHGSCTCFVFSLQR